MHPYINNSRKTQPQISNPDPPKIHSISTKIQPRSTKIHQDPPRSTKNHQDPHKIRQDPQKSTKIHQHSPKSIRIHPRSTKIHQDPPRSTKIHQDPPSSTKIHNSLYESFQVMRLCVRTCVGVDTAFVQGLLPTCADLRSTCAKCMWCLLGSHRWRLGLAQIYDGCVLHLLPLSPSLSFYPFRRLFFFFLSVSLSVCNCMLPTSSSQLQAARRQLPADSVDLAVAQRSFRNKFWICGCRCCCLCSFLPGISHTFLHNFSKCKHRCDCFGCLSEIPHRRHCVFVLFLFMGCRYPSFYL